MVTCHYCHKLLVRRLGESSYTFRSRRYCDRTCMGAGSIGSRKMEARYWPTAAAWLLNTRDQS